MNSHWGCLISLATKLIFYWWKIHLIKNTEKKIEFWRILHNLRKGVCSWSFLKSESSSFISTLEKIQGCRNGPRREVMAMLESQVSSLESPMATTLPVHDVSSRYPLSPRHPVYIPVHLTVNRLLFFSCSFHGALLMHACRSPFRLLHASAFASPTPPPPIPTPLPLIPTPLHAADLLHRRKTFGIPFFYVKKENQWEFFFLCGMLHFYSMIVDYYSNWDFIVPSENSQRNLVIYLL